MDLSAFFRKGFLIWILAGSLLSFVLVFFFTSSLFIKPLYQSEAIIFVPLTLFQKQLDQGGIGFGGDAEIDAHIQLLLSNQMLVSLAQHFNGEYPELSDNLDNPSDHKHLDQFRKNISVEKNRYGSVSIKVKHHDAQKAAYIANLLIDLGDSVKMDILHQNQHEAYLFAKSMYHEKLEEIALMDQNPVLWKSKIGLQSISSDNAETGFRIIYEEELRELVSLKNQYEMLRKITGTPLPSAYVFSPAIPTDKPSWPPRLLLSVAGALIFIAIFIFMEIVRHEAKSTKSA
jgi:uncharacterized protein involved in exopolysaccharide biosynthesis